MAMSRRRLMPLIILMSLLLGTGAVAVPVSAAEEAVLIPGASPFKWINPLYPIIAKSYRFIGVNLHDDDHPQVIRYSQNPFATDRALRQGVEHADSAVRAIDGKVVVIGESMGSMVAARLAAELAAGEDPPSPDDIRFVLIASPEVGVAEYFKVGRHVPLVNYTVSRVPKTPYPTAIVIGEYDPWADPPDRPWNLVADANAVMGMFYVHGPASWDVDLSKVPPEDITVDGTVTTYFIRTEELPLTRPFRDLGVPDRLVDRVDRFLRPIIDAGYRRHDKPGDSRPYLSDGRIRRDVGEASGSDRKQIESPRPQRHVGRDDRRGRDDPDAQESTTDRAERRAQRQAGDGSAAHAPRSQRALAPGRRAG